MDGGSTRGNKLRSSKLAGKGPLWCLIGNYFTGTMEDGESRHDSRSVAPDFTPAPGKLIDSFFCVLDSQW